MKVNASSDTEAWKCGIDRSMCIRTSSNTALGAVSVTWENRNGKLVGIAVFPGLTWAHWFNLGTGIQDRPQSPGAGAPGSAGATEGAGGGAGGGTAVSQTSGGSNAFVQEPCVSRSPEALRLLVPGQVAWDNALTAYYNDDWDVLLLMRRPCSANKSLVYTRMG